MKKEDFLKEIQDILVLDEELNMNSPIEIDSLGNLMLIAFLDENFEVRVTAEVIKKINNVSQLVNLIGKDKIID